ncbi:MAG TPA: hypothetical protein VMJ92_04675 [Candidatus Limnocylindrales bacterium]|nr:hypothetical protein [Candidatus Limnocylindrales bacterium]
MGCCLGGCVRLLFFWLWRAIAAALLAVVFARIDSYLERSRWRDSAGGRAWRSYRSRGTKAPRGGPSGTIDTRGRPLR